MRALKKRDSQKSTGRDPSLKGTFVRLPPSSTAQQASIAQRLATNGTDAIIVALHIANLLTDENLHYAYKQVQLEQLEAQRQQLEAQP